MFDMSRRCFDDSKNAKNSRFEVCVEKVRRKVHVSSGLVGRFILFALPYIDTLV